MSSASMLPAEAIAQYLHSQIGLTQVCVAYSGGMDSHVLLHAAQALLHDHPDVSLRAIHINHNLAEDSEQWVRHAEFICDGLNVPLVVRNVEVDQSADGPEASARLARYAAFAEALDADEQLFLAQHADDQAETFLLQALRGSGPDGLSSIPRKRTFATGYMARPLLPCTQQSLADYAQQHGLSWIEDPSNSDTGLDRNYIRHEVLPLLKARWPAATRTLSRAAMRSAAACQTLNDLAREDLIVVRVRGSNELSISGLKALPRERCFNTVRLWVRQAGMRMPRLQDLHQLVSDLLYSREDASGIVNVRDYEFRRHSDRLYLVLSPVSTDAFEHQWDAPFDDLLIAETGQILSRAACVEQGIQLPSAGSITVRSRTGGELIKLGEPTYHKAVKKVLQEAAIPPWQRDTLPLLYMDGRLVAVWNVAVAIDFKATPEIA